MIGTILSGAIGLVLPLFASYRALISNDISLIRPWLMYWVVFASFEFAEGALRPLLQLVPFYGLARLGFVAWLVAPQTQGAVQLYQTRIEPWLSARDAVFDRAIARAVEWVRRSPLSGLLALLGIELPKPPAAGAAGGQPGGGSITDMFMSRFRLAGSPDFNLAAYLPSMLGTSAAAGGSGSGAPESGAAQTEYRSVVRNSLLGMIRSLDGSDGTATTATTVAVQSEQPAGASLREAVDDYDFVETPKKLTPQPGETEIEREVEDQLRQGRAAEPAQPGVRNRWFKSL